MDPSINEMDPSINEMDPIIDGFDKMDPCKHTLIRNHGNGESCCIKYYDFSGNNNLLSRLRK